MNKIPNFFKAVSGAVATVYSAGSIDHLYSQKKIREYNQLNDVVADGCNFTYQTYVKNIKKQDRKLTNDESTMAMQKTIGYVSERVSCDKDHMKRLVEDRLLLIKKT